MKQTNVVESLRADNEHLRTLCARAAEYITDSDLIDSEDWKKLRDAIREALDAEEKDETGDLKQSIVSTIRALQKYRNNVSGNKDKEAAYTIAIDCIKFYLSEWMCKTDVMGLEIHEPKVEKFM